MARKPNQGAAGPAASASAPQPPAAAPAATAPAAAAASNPTPLPKRHEVRHPDAGLVETIDVRGDELDSELRAIERSIFVRHELPIPLSHLSDEELLEINEEENEPSDADIRALLTPGVRTRLTEELRKAEQAVKHGPAGMGWAYNETKRSETEAWAAFLRELVAHLPPAEAAAE
jgi:hypothetical protein